MLIYDDSEKYTKHENLQKEKEDKDKITPIFLNI